MIANRDRLLNNHTFVFNPSENGGESLSLHTKIHSNGDPGKNGIYLNQILTLMSYCNSASFNFLGFMITPEVLRKLADELEVALKEAAKLNEN